MKAEQIEGIYGLGFKKWIDYSVDPSDKDGGEYEQTFTLGQFRKTPENDNQYMTRAMKAVNFIGRYFTVSIIKTFQRVV